MKIRKGLITIACAIVSAALFFSLMPGCSQFSKSMTEETSTGSSAVSSNTDKLNDKSRNSKYNINDFYSIKKVVTKSFYVNTANAYKSYDCKDRFDFDGDGKEENLIVNFKIDETGDITDTTVTIGSSSDKPSMLGLAGIYAVKLDKTSNENILAVVEYNTDDYIITHFYRYKSGKLIKLGDFSGAFENDPQRQPCADEYNEQILVDGYGDIIPRYSVMTYVTPAVFLNVYKLDGDGFNKVFNDPSNSLCDEYTINTNVMPFFEQGNYNCQNYTPKCTNNDIESLSVGDKIKILNVSTKLSNQECALVRLSDGRQGILYFYLTP